MFDYHIIKQVVELWSREDPDSQEHRAPLRFSHVKAIMETVFLAGLKREEERPVQVSVSLIDPESLNDEAHGETSIALRIERRMPFSVDSLVKLSSAFDPLTTSLGVAARHDDPNTLEIWGAVFASKRGRNRFDALHLELSPPDVLTISSRKSGALSVFRGGDIIARFSAGRFSEPTPTPFTSSLMGWSLLKVIKSHPEFKRLGTKYWRTYRDLIDRLLVEASKRGHGGTIVWLPEEALESSRNWVIHKYILDDAPEGAPILERLCAMDLRRGTGLTALEAEISATQARSLEDSLLDQKRRVVEHVELLAQLTRVDGALILSDRLRPISFGSVLVAPPWKGETIFGPSSESQEPVQVDLSGYGTRHNSAVNFVGKSPVAVVFVLSQDGPIAGVTQKDEQTIYWWPDCLSKLWAA